MKAFLLTLGLSLAPVAAFAQQTAYPLTIENGGNTLVFEAAPERAVSLNGHTTEVMLSLGLADHMVGTSYMNHPVIEPLAADYDTIPQLADGTSYPSLEVLLGADPDFTYGRLSAYRDTSVAPIETLAGFGINAYAVKGTLIDGATIEDVYEDIDNLGQIFDIQDRANALIAEMQADIEAVSSTIDNAAVEPVSVLVYDSGTDGIYTAGTALQTNLIELAGGRNVFDDLDSTWETVSWEEAVAREPEVIVINDYGQTSADEKIALLTENPALSSVPAIQNKRFVVLPLPSMFEGVRIPDGVKTLAQGFHPELFE
ncbi:lipoprotein [Devosia pacifica]|uniref:Lipoprotein n=1 Tax=Devosia pacifica TaxID=1335967 RepID=A0A918S138_9HYPH|nr:ABC transporter substrate-binding protein [Devosia pacifica]GHA18825.1 lipoprotein [Devosia pacifica]